ncbi:MAG: F0F1 ATP synthase subunit B [Sedimentisphaerales bacterium]|nr:F0F1 ATP synthase subunit B [Sedimentisphaerales bacterium]
MLRYALWILVVKLMTPCVLLASEAAESHGSGEGKTNVFAGDLGMSIFTVAIFAVLVLILSKWAWGPLLEGLKRRESHIRHSIEETELAREEAFLSLKQYELRLGRAQSEAQEVIEKGRADAQQIANKLKATAQQQAEEILAKAKQEIEMAKMQVMHQVYEQAAELSTELAGRIINRSLNAEDHMQLIRDSIAQMHPHPSDN